MAAFGNGGEQRAGITHAAFADMFLEFACKPRKPHSSDHY